MQVIVGQLKECAGHTDILIVPGGWIFADMVRDMELDDTTAHWLAIKAMDLYGYYISSFGICVVDPVESGFDISGVNVILPFRLVKTYDELPHSWEVTSDSIAVWIAHKMGIKEVIKLTDVDGIEVNGEVLEEVRTEDILHIGTCVDGHCPSLMGEFGVDMFVCNGLKDRVKDYIFRGKAVGTRIKAHN